MTTNDDAAPNDDVVTDPTSGEAPRNAEADNQKQLIASLNATAREKAEQAKAAEARAAAAEARLDAALRAQSPAAPNNDTDLVQRIRENGSAEDVAAALELMQQREAERDNAFIMLQREQGNVRLLDQIKDEDEREETRKEFSENRNLYGTPREAHAAVRARKLAVENAELLTKQEELQAALRASQAPNGKAPPTHHRDTPSPTTKVTPMTRDEVEEAKSGLDSFGRLQLEERIDRGEIRITR